MEKTITPPRRTGWFKLNDTWIRLTEVQVWNWSERSNVMHIFIRERRDPVFVTCDHLQAQAFEAAIQEL